MKQLFKQILLEPVLHMYWLFRVLRVKVIKWIPTYNEDEFITAHNCDFMKDKRFMDCYNAGVKAGLAVSDKIHWRAHVCCWAATQGEVLEGDFVECGVNKGFLSKIVVDYLDFGKLPKTFYLMDTYEGLVDRYITKEEKKKGVKAGGYEPCYELVVNTFKPYKNVKVIKGAIPDMLAQITARKIAYLSIDMNCVLPEIAAIEYFWDKLVPGAIVVLDDYGHSGHELQKYAFDEFVEKKGVEILSLPTGQGLIIKS